MSITSLIFIIFVALIGIVYYLVPKKAQWAVLLIASLIFYALSSTVLTVFMLISTLLIYLGAIKIQSLGDEFKAKRQSLKRQREKH